MTATLVDISLPDGSSTKMTVYNSNPVQPVIILLPALGIAASYYQNFAETLAAKNLTVVTTDLRGLGNSSVEISKNVDFGYNEIIELDWHYTLKKVAELFPENKKYVLGHSLGGQLACLHASKYPGMIHGIILSASCSIHYKGWDGFGRARVLFAAYFFPALSKLLGYFPGKKVGFGGTESRGVMTDWGRTAKTGKYIIENSDYDFEKGLSRLNIPVLALSYSGDDYAPKRAVENLYKKLHPASAIQHIHVEERDSKGRAYSHYSWVRYPEPIIDRITNWLKIVL